MLTLLPRLHAHATAAPITQGVANAAVVKGAEAYYRNMFFGGEITWNLRDRHFLVRRSRMRL